MPFPVVVHGLMLCSLILVSGPARAQMGPNNPPPTKPAQFTYNGVTYSYYTFSEAEAALQKMVPNGTLLKRKSTFTSPGIASYTKQVDFGFDDMEPEHYYDAGYNIGGWISSSKPGFCTAVGAPGYADYCADEQAAVASALADKRQAYPHCNVYGSRTSGAYASPYASSIEINSREGRLDFGSGKMHHHEMMCPGWTAPITYNWQLGQVVGYRCALGFYPLRSYNPSDYGLKLCRNSNSYRITETVRNPGNSCPVNANPCHPATGDKSRAEQDFVFAGRPFVRHYHSRFDLSKVNRIGQHCGPASLS